MYKLRDWIDPDKIDWERLSGNPAPAAMHLLEQHPDKIHWYSLSDNPAPAAIRLLEEHPAKIKWDWLSGNPAAIHLLEQYPDKIDWWWFSRNPAIFVYDYAAMRISKAGLHEELIQNRFHPRNIPQFAGWGFKTGFA